MSWYYNVNLFLIKCNTTQLFPLLNASHSCPLTLTHMEHIHEYTAQTNEGNMKVIRQILITELFKLKIFTDVYCICILYHLLRTKGHNGQWKPKSSTRQRLDSNSHWRWKKKNQYHRLIRLSWISSGQLLMWLSSVFGPCGAVCTPENIWAAHHELSDGVLGISSKTWIRASVSCWFRSGEHEGQSMASMASSSRNLTHNLDIWGRASPGPQGILGPLHQCRSENHSEDFILTAVWLPLAMTWRSMWPSKDMLRPSLTHHQTIMLDDVTGSRTFTTESPDFFTPVTCVQCEPDLICEDNKAQMEDLVFSGECQRSCSSLLEVIL